MEEAKGMVWGPSVISTEEIDTTQRMDLGKGAFGDVYTARVRGELVAVKEIVRSENVEEAFKQELANLRAANKNHVVMLLGAVVDNPEKLMLVMEYMPGGDLDDLIFGKKFRGKDGKLTRGPVAEVPPMKRLRILRDVARGMRWLHSREQPIIHRDLKPENIMLDAHGRAKVADFGLSDLVLKTERFTDAGDPKGTPKFNAPEVFSKGDITTKADVFSFGSIVYVTVTGCALFANMSEDKVRDAICNGKMPRTDGLPLGLRELLNGCWAHDPASRLDFEVVVNMLDQIIASMSFNDGEVEGFYFWLRDIGTVDFVSWRTFWANFVDAVPDAADPISEALLRALLIPKDIQERQLQETGCPEGHITVDRFGEITKALPPGMSGYVSFVKTILDYHGFFGEYSTNSAILRLDSEPVGTYILRLSSTVPGAWTVSVRKADKIKHVRFFRQATGYFCSDPNVFHSSFYEMFNAISAAHKLGRPCDGSPLKHAIHPISGGY